jgi:multisubunit Na+/H+ antiporter MnhB subunit
LDRQIMLNSALQRTAVRAVSTALGGYGVFCVYMSFLKPWVGMDALILLGAACVMHYFTEA